ncbi:MULTISPECIES: hypothetical protein [Corynebacterium]|uniref:Uncharacterized protein n=1 Tax=Corynebacterium pseudogenitalium TaxID=38303 RepID=A0ABD4TLI0_9CORY|nr:MULTISPECIES: hypothetical protein [Corynebacterium]MCQ4613197.1 hypothetical protein [Corynebacterium pseudogenitalium]MCQ4615274.1 hypothetical protein [Corynebacterium pseudogenitalium]MDK8363235.1 hypothetical protein [Corynebacterium sp. UMB10119B]OIR45215.1 hypothetical protein BJP06_01935 [Corynebacterium sp. NML120713]
MSSLRSTFQSDVDEFIEDLRVFASGEYLQEQDLELWEAPFDPAVLPELREILEIFLDTASLVAQPVDDATIRDLYTGLIANLEEFNAKHQYAVLEPEEMSDIEGIFAKVSAQIGADPSVVQELFNRE